MNKESYDRRFWQDGVASQCNIVSFDGENVRGVARVEDNTARAAIIEAHNAIVREMAAQVCGC